LRFIVDAVVETMLAPATRAHDPEAVGLLRESVTNADRGLLRNAVQSISLGREDLTPLLPHIDVPTLMITGVDDKGWTPAQQEASIATVRDGRAAVVPDAAYLAPLERPAAVADLLAHFWAGIDAEMEGVKH
jgi:pimeloyl-ACP methyl ester carboxylesterase